MQTRKFDELISYFNRNVSNMDIDQKYKIELLGMITAIGFAHEKELHAPTIEPERKKGKWIYGESEAGNDGYYCSKCGNFVPWKYDEYDIDFIKEFLFCNKCGAEMRTPVETARDIVHEAINNSVWADTVDTAKMHKVVDNKYAEMTKKTEESKRCDTCKHEKSHWFSRCADCSDYELWEGKDETGRSTNKEETHSTGRGGSRTRTGIHQDDPGDGGRHSSR